MTEIYAVRSAPKPYQLLVIAVFALAFTLTAVGANVEPRPPITTTATMVVPGTPDQVFKLFAPAQRSEWDPKWSIEITSPGKGRPDGPGAEYVNLNQPDTSSKVVSLDAGHRVIQLDSVRPGFYDLSIRIVCSAADGGQTSVEVTYTAVAHSDVMHEAIAASLAHQIEDVVVGKDGWRDRLTHFLTEGVRFSPFEPVAIERRHIIQYDQAPDRVFAVVNPADGNHWTTSTPEYVFGSAAEPSGAMWRRRDAWYLVAHYDPVERSMKTVLYMPETEFMIEELRCDPAPGGGTTMTVTWRVAGLPPDGNEAVQGFFDQYWETRMTSLEETYRIQLAREANAP